MLHKYKSDEPEYDFNYEVEILVHRLERAGLKETFEDFMGLVLDQFIIRFGIGQIILDTEEREIYHWLEDPVNFYVNRYDDYFELLSFMDEFELTLMFVMLYMTIRQISEKDK